MAILQIPINNAQPDQEFSIELDRVVFFMRFTFNYRSRRWMMTIKDVQQNILIAGVVMVSNWLVLNRFKKVGLPTGTFYTWDSTGKNQNPDEDNFGDTVLLLYEEANGV